MRNLSITQRGFSRTNSVTTDLYVESTYQLFNRVVFKLREWKNSIFELSLQWAYSDKNPPLHLLTTDFNVVEDTVKAILIANDYFQYQFANEPRFLFHKYADQLTQVWNTKVCGHYRDIFYMLNAGENTLFDFRFGDTLSHKLQRINKGTLVVYKLTTKADGKEVIDLFVSFKDEVLFNFHYHLSDKTKQLSQIFSRKLFNSTRTLKFSVNQQYTHKPAYDQVVAIVGICNAALTEAY